MNDVGQALKYIKEWEQKNSIKHMILSTQLMSELHLRFPCILNREVWQAQITGLCCKIRKLYRVVAFQHYLRLTS